MNIEEAKERLSCYRPGIDDPADELFAPALSVAERDPELAEWMQNQQEFDSALRGHLRNAELPPGLLAHLQSNGAISVPGYDEESEEPVPVAAPKAQKTNIIPMSLWTRVAAAAAVIVVGIFALNSLNSSASAVESFRGDMVKVAADGFSLDHKSGILSENRDWLARHGAPIYDDCRPCINLKKGVGCKKIEWRDNTVSVLCFEKETGKVVHMFVVARGALAEKLAGDKVPYRLIEGLQTGGWLDDKNVYLLVGANGEVVVRDLL